MAEHTENLLGKTVAFEGPEGEGSIACKGIVTKETADKIYVSASKGYSGWIDKSDITEPE